MLILKQKTSSDDMKRHQTKLHLIFPANWQAGFSTRHPDKPGPAATASTGLFPTPFLIRIIFLSARGRLAFGSKEQ
jgi:hypothetical protein